MVDKILITNKLTKFFKTVNIESFFKIFIISFLYDKCNYIEKIVGLKNTINMLDKYIYNLEQNLKYFKKLDNYHSIYAKYNFKTKTLQYFMTNDYKKNKKNYESNNEKKLFIIKEFKIMIYKELEKIVNIYSLNGIIISNGFYLNDKQGRYPEYEGDFSKIIDIFSDLEVCDIIDTDNKIKVFLDDKKEYYVYARHVSQMNSEVICYVDLWKKFIDEKLYYFSLNNPKKYTEQMINNFDSKYEYILKSRYNFKLQNNSVFALIENYILHIKNRIEYEDNNIEYHQDLSVIFKLMNKAKYVNNYSNYILHSTNNKLNFEEI